MEKVIMSGNEAVARGAYEAGVLWASAYPGTPSTEILENTAKYKEIHSQWSNNEKVALETACGASIGGERAFAAMKHVGLNVAADPLMTIAYEGVNGGLVVITADDPGCHSSQNEQDNRNYATLGKVLMLEPSDSQECKDMFKLAFEMSERFDMVVLFRMTTRVCHSKSIVELGERQEPKIKKYVSDKMKFAMLPASARLRHIAIEENLEKARAYAETSPLNIVEYNGDNKVGIITSGISYQHCREAFGDTVSYLKLGITNPLADNLIKEFCEKCETVHVVEEGDGYLEIGVRHLKLDCTGKELITCQGELTAEIVKTSLTEAKSEPTYDFPQLKDIPARPPVFCAGCPHRGFFYSMSKFRDKVVGMGDIGCYGLGWQEPFNCEETCVCMDAGTSTTIGMANALKNQDDTRKPLGFQGDSTFFHGGFTGFIDAVHYNTNAILCILDNDITAMTGHQLNAANDTGLMGEPVHKLNVTDMIYATGIDKDRVAVVDPMNQAEMDGALKHAIETDGLQVIVTKYPCALLKWDIQQRAGRHCVIDADKCVGCKMCMKVACPALAFDDGKAHIADPAACTGCGLCMQNCKVGAITKVGE
ncbi:MAG: thiamine pyrophosphate-dependent enzyme [Eubacteriaceae bacterium]|jgi:indolepyruvate ferredoxin oxidoreductase alpha subunit|nr:thiamine pyrophosphate-dependent enzyme [Eubacteriaceae bacterium]